MCGRCEYFKIEQRCVALDGMRSTVYFFDVLHDLDDLWAALLRAGQRLGAGGHHERRRVQRDVAEKDGVLPGERAGERDAGGAGAKRAAGPAEEAGQIAEGGALGLGEGGEQNAPLGRAVIGGLVFATVSTLLFVPVLFAGVHQWREKRRARTAAPVLPLPAVAPTQEG